MLVPFGRREQVGMVLDLTDKTNIAPGKLRRAKAQLDARPLLRADDLWLVRFTSDYYHHPIGECVAAAIPSLLRQGRSLDNKVSIITITDGGRAVDLDALARRAPRQAEAMAVLMTDGPISQTDAAKRINGWQRIKRPLIEKGWLALEEQAAEEPVSGPALTATAGPSLNPEQRQSVDAILDRTGFHVSLLDGITGSGKTEVYLRVMAETLRAKRQVLILVPEIGLTPQLVARLEKRLGSRPHVLHSSRTDHERLAAWRAARSGEAGVVLGTRSAVFTPLKHPGLIVVDEEHDPSLKQQEGLRYSARDLAVARAKRLGIPIILGSATPSTESASHAANGTYRHLTLTQRAGGAVPPLTRLIDLGRFPSPDGLSQPLVAAIRTHIDQRRQALIFLNRRGFAPTLICQACGHVAECQRCDARMTVHRNQRTLACHHCGANRPLDDCCSQCGAPCVPLGQGTERVEEALRTHFPEQTITRIDSDSTRLKGAMDEALAKAHSGEAKILVGTQLLSKGHHFRHLGLVGVINADQGLFSTDFRSSERLAQSLTQVAGRAGREREQGEVLIQTAFPKHAFWKALLSGGYHEVLRQALKERQASGWPPASYLALIRASAHRQQQTFDFLEQAARLAASAVQDAVRVLGPVSAPMARRAGRYRGQLLLQSANRQALHAGLHALRAALADDASARRVRWSIDVDPIELF